MSKTLLVVLESAVKFLLNVLYLSKNEIKVTSEHLHVLSERRKVTALWYYLALQNLDSKFAELSAKLVLLLAKVVL